MTVIKRNRQDNNADLINAIKTLIPLLKDQHEDEAVEALQSAAEQLKKTQPQSADHKAAIKIILDAFEGDHELIAYTFQREKSSEWTEVEELSQASARVLSLARRMQ